MINCECIEITVKKLIEEIQKQISTESLTKNLPPGLARSSNVLILSLAILFVFSVMMLSKEKDNGYTVTKGPR